MDFKIEKLQFVFYMPFFTLKITNMKKRNQMMICILTTVLLTFSIFSPVQAGENRASNEMFFANCPSPTSLSIEVEEQNILLSWSVVEEAIGYEVGYYHLNSGETETTETGGNSHEFSDMPAGEYEVWVRSICGNGDSSPPIYSIVIVEELDLFVIDDCICDLFFQSQVVDQGEGRIFVGWDENGTDDPEQTLYHLVTEIDPGDGNTVLSDFKFKRQLTGTYSISLCDTINPPVPIPGTTNQFGVYNNRGLLLTITIGSGGMTLQWHVNNQGSYYYDMSHCFEDTQRLRTESHETFDLSTEVDLFPNPFHSDFTFSYTLSEEAVISFELFDAMGNKIARPLTPLTRTAGKYQMNYSADHLNAGVYYGILKLNEERQMIKLIKLD